MASNVVFCVNAKFGALVPVVVESILLNSTVDCNFYVIYSGIDEKTKAECKKIIVANFKERPAGNHSITFIRFDPQKALTDRAGKMLTPKFRGGYDAYTRIFLPSLLMPYGIENCLYLDVDLVANKNIDWLLDYASKVKVVAGVKDTSSNDKNPFLTEDFINSGVLVLNLTKLRYMEFTKKCLAFIEEHQPSPPDQEVINNVLHSSDKELIDQIYNECSARKDKYRKAAIIHFTGSYKPWMIQTRWREKKFIWYKYSYACKCTLSGKSISRSEVELFMRRRVPFRFFYNLWLEISTKILGRRTPMDPTFEGQKDR